MENTLHELLQRLNDSLAGSGYPFKLELVNTGDVVRLDKNARFMPAEQFKNLVENVKRDGGLSSVPFCWKTREGRFHCLSGNHRVEAAEKAGQKNILVLYTDKPLSRQEQVAIQLSHNAIAGQDDLAILKSLWAEIEDVALKYYAGLDDKTLGELANVSGSGLSPVRMDYRTVTFLFLPEEAERLEAILQEAVKEAKAGADTVHVARFADFERLLKAMQSVKDSANVKNSALALMLILDGWYEQQQQRQAAASGAPAEAQGTGTPDPVRTEDPPSGGKKPGKGRANRRATSGRA